MCKGTLDVYCIECSRMVGWRKEHVVRDDGYYDWRIVATCGCGEIEDPEIREAARAAYERDTAYAIFHAQEAAMEQILGPEKHAEWNEVMDGGKRAEIERAG